MRLHLILILWAAYAILFVLFFCQKADFRRAQKNIHCSGGITLLCSIMSKVKLLYYCMLYYRF